MVIPYGAIVVDVSARPEEGRETAFEVVFCRRGADGSYGAEERATVRSRERRALIRQAIDSGHSCFWGGWFGLDEKEALTRDIARSRPLFAWQGRNSSEPHIRSDDV